MCYTRQTRSGLKSDSPGILCDCVSFSMLTCSVQKYFPQVAILTTWCSVHECSKSFLYIYRKEIKLPVSFTAGNK